MDGMAAGFVVDAQAKGRAQAALLLVQVYHFVLLCADTIHEWPMYCQG